MFRSAQEFRSARWALRLFLLAPACAYLVQTQAVDCCAQELRPTRTFHLPRDVPTVPDSWRPDASQLGSPATDDSIALDHQSNARGIGGQTYSAVGGPAIEPWWTGPVSSPFRADAPTIRIDLNSLFALTAVRSDRVLAVAQKPWINQMLLEQARATFDPTLYSDHRFDSTSDPAESTLATGGPPRLEEDIVGLNSGLRGRTTQGANYQVGQRLGHKNSNSTFFLPNDQGSARLFANLKQPLMRGRAIDANRSLVLTASFETNAAESEYLETLQNQLFEVANAYWSLYSERATLLLRQRHLDRALEITELLFAREGFDSPSSQVLRAKATVATRTAELVQSDALIRNQESRLRALINAQELTSDRDAEFLPVQPARLLTIEVDAEQQVTSAQQKRPELAELYSQLNIANTQLRLAQDQVKPTLDLVAEGYLAGLAGQSDVFGAFGNQFTDGRPGYAAGLVYERPIGNRSALAVVRQRQYEVQRVQHLIAETTETIRAEVETAVRNIYAAKSAALSREISRDAAQADVDVLKDRWKTLGNDPRLGQLQLNDLLSSQDRLLQEELNLLLSLVQFNLAVLELQRSSGSLVQFAR